MLVSELKRNSEVMKPDEKEGAIKDCISEYKYEFKKSYYVS
jgi:hypothetical protein